MHEVIKWPLQIWLLFTALNVAIVLSIGVALSNSAILFVALALFVTTLLFAYKSRLVLDSSMESLAIGRVRIDSKFIGEVIILDPVKMKYELGAGLDRRAYLAIRHWVKGGLKVILNDPLDPTPYWLISSKNPELIKASLGK